MSTSESFLFITCGNKSNRSPISLALSGVMMFDNSVVFKPKEVTKTLSSANVALIKILRSACSKL